MTRAQDIEEVSPGIFLWRAYDDSVKAELWSTAVETPTGIYVVDPIPLEQDCFHQLAKGRKIGGICVTNVNHARVATEFAKTLSVPIFTSQTLCGNPDLLNATAVRDGETFAEGLQGISIDGAPLGEMALYANANTMILGDALIHFEPRGLEFLPTKYCQDAKVMRQSLRKLLDHQFERMFFAHGLPILSGARKKLEQLLSAS